METVVEKCKQYVYASLLNGKRGRSKSVCVCECVEVRGWWQAAKILWQAQGVIRPDRQTQIETPAN